MRVGVAIVVAVVPTFAALGLFGRGGDVPQAYACTGDQPTTASLVRQAVFVGVVDAVEVGDDVNRQPALTPSATITTVGTQAPPESPTRASYLDFSSPTSTPESPMPTATPTVYTDLRLRGTGATLRVSQAISGSAPDDFSVDGEERAKFERILRQLEAASGAVSMCVFPPPDYELGRSYLVIVERTFVGGREFNTMLRFRLDRNEVMLGQATTFGHTYLSMSRSEYASYFPGAPTLADLPSELPYVYITAERVPLAQFVRFVQGVRGASIVTLPETGSAGLATGRD